MTDKAKPIEIFKAGKHTAMSGVDVAFTESQLEASASAYDPSLHEAPLVIGHPTHDGPAYGWVASLSAKNGSLEMMPTQVDPAFAEMHASGRFKKRSAAFYHPDSPSNPVPGVYYLKHVGFLGAMPPAVKGLRTAEFSENEDGVVTLEFGESERWAFDSITGLFRNLREWIIEKHGRDEANKLLPEYAIDDVNRAAQQESEEAEDNSLQSAFSEPTEPTQEDNGMTEEEKQAQAKREANLKAREEAVAFAEKQQSQRETKDFVAKQVADGKVLPNEEAGMVAFMSAISSGDMVVEFGEGDEAQKLDPVAWLKGYIQRQPKVVEFGEVTPPAGEEAEQVAFSAPKGFQTDPSQMKLHQKILAYAESNGVSYEVALKSVN